MRGPVGPRGVGSGAPVGAGSRLRQTHLQTGAAGGGGDPPADGQAPAPADHQRRVQGVSPGDSGGLRQAASARTPLSSGPASTDEVPAAGGAGVCHGAQDAKERAGGEGRGAAWVWDGGGVGGGPGGFAGQHGGQHVVHRTAERDGSPSQQPEGPQDLPLQQELGASPGGNVLHDVLVQLLLAGADASGTDRPGALPPSNASPSIHRPIIAQFNSTSAAPGVWLRIFRRDIVCFSERHITSTPQRSRYIRPTSASDSADSSNTLVTTCAG